MYNLPTVASYDRLLKESLATREYRKQKKAVADKSCRHLRPLKIEAGQVFDDAHDEVYDIEHQVCPLCGHHLNHEELKARDKVLARFNKLYSK